MFKISLFLTLFLLFICTEFSYAQSTKIMLVRNFDVLVNCTLNTIGKKEAGFSGLDIDYFIRIADISGLDINSWNFQCVENASEIYNMIQSNPQLYIGGIGGIKVSFDLLQSGFLFSYPTMNTGLSILVSSSADNWMFLRVFELRFGILLLATAFCIGILLFILEKQAYSLEKYLWHAFSSLYFCSSVKLEKTPSRIVMVAYWFMILIIISTYTAQMTNIKSISQILNAINSASGLNQKTIKTFDEYEFYLYPLGAKAVTTSFPTNLNTVEEDFWNSGIDGYVLDDVIARTYAYQSCDINIVGRLFQPISYAILFSSEQNSTLINQLNQAIEIYNQNVSLISMIDEYLTQNNFYVECFKTMSVNSYQITIEDIQGLWIIMASAISFSTILFILTKMKCYKRFRTFLNNWNITEKTEKFEEGIKYGDDLIVQNLRDVNYKLMRNMEILINDRLVEMDEKVMKFYELLLSCNNESENDSEISRSQSDNEDNEESKTKVVSPYKAIVAISEFNSSDDFKINCEESKSNHEEKVDIYHSKTIFSPKNNQDKLVKLKNIEIREDTLELEGLTINDIDKKQETKTNNNENIYQLEESCNFLDNGLIQCGGYDDLDSGKESFDNLSNSLQNKLIPTLRKIDEFKLSLPRLKTPNSSRKNIDVKENTL